MRMITLFKPWGKFALKLTVEKDFLNLNYYEHTFYLYFDLITIEILVI